MTHREQYLKRNKLEDKPYSISELSKISGISKADLEEINNRGRGAWKTNIKSVRMKGTFKKNVDAPRSQKLSPEQWGMARVYAFLNKKDMGADKVNHDTDILKKYSNSASGVNMDWKPEFKRSTKEFKKYMVVTPKGRTVHFGDKRYQHYRDTTGKGLYSRLDHNNPKRRQLYRIRHKAIKTKDGTPAYKDKEKPAYYAYNYLW